MQGSKCFFLEIYGMSFIFDVFFILILVLLIPLLTKKFNVIDLQIKLNCWKLNFKNKNRCKF
jgi:hypothetical protein